MNLPIALALAILAGLSFNIMPCVLPVLPLVLMRLVEQSRHNASRRIGLGLAFCGGIVLFFAAFAAIAVVLKFSTGAVVDWSNHLRYPAVVTTMGLLLVVFALFMFDVFTIGLPSSVAGRSTSGGGAMGSAGMGFLAALLSTPCSGAILAAVLVWAQTQHWAISSLAIVLMGAGMAIPYAIVVFVPGFLRLVPKPGVWMDIFRKSMGFILLVIAFKLLGSLPRENLVHVLFYGVVLSFCVWMWGGWVSFSTPSVRKWCVRLTAIAIAIVAAVMILRPVEKLIDWQTYDAAVIRTAVENKRPVVIKFTADWCTNCVLVERRVYEDAAVVQLIRNKGILAVKADTTMIDYPATVDLRQVYGEAGTVPTTIVLSDGQPPIKLRGIFDKQELIRILQPLPDGGR
jgi:thiol:disulfide interchange protein DsbD